jgi:ribose transport system ATP-binding protein
MFSSEDWLTMNSHPSETPILSLHHITKTYPGVIALDDAQFELKAGEVHALIGENGAGKSTLIKAIAGAHQADKGEIRLAGQPVKIRTPHRANEMGIYTIYQEVTYIPHMSVAENMFLGREHTKGGLISHREQTARTRQMFIDFGYDIDPRAMAKDLNVAELRMISIIKALNNDVKILILDEPTASLTDREKDLLFSYIRRLRDKGAGVIYISHRLEEIKEVCDRATVFRNGRYIDTLEMKDVTSIDDLVPLMVGKEVGDKYPKVVTNIGEVLLRVDKLTREGFFEEISLELRAGEVLGFFGLVGCGFEEVFRSVFGASTYDSGVVEVCRNGVFTAFKKGSPKAALDMKISYIPRDRKYEGLVMPMSIKENIVISTYHRFVRTIFGYIQRAKVDEIAEKYSRQMRIKAPSSLTKVETLSGGNQQKVVMAKSLCRGGNVFLFNEPTAGIDVGSKVEIYQFMNQLTANGAGVILVSYELPEVMGMSDRIMVMHQGRVVREFDQTAATEEEILKSAFGAEKEYNDPQYA